MNNSVEKKAATVEEAIELALAELGAKLEDCFVEVFDEGAAGHILGIGRRDAHVSVSLDQDGALASTNAKAAEVSEKPQGQARSYQRSEQRPAYEKNRNDNRGNGNNRQRNNRRDSNTSNVNTVVPEEANVAMDYVAGVLAAMDIHGKMSSYMRGDVICIDIMGDDVGAAIGHQGCTLDAINRLTRIATSKEHHVKLVVDVGGYRRRRERELRQLVQSTVQEAAHLDIEIQLDPMNAMDRRYIHGSLMHDPDVGTYSVGEGSKRAVVIAPKHLVPENAKSNYEMRSKEAN